MKSNGLVEFLGTDGWLKTNPECNNVIFHGNGTFFDVGFGSGKMRCKNLTLAAGKVYNFRGAKVVIKPGGSLTADGGDCAGYITLQIVEGSSANNGFGSEGPDLNLDWCTLANIGAFNYGGTPHFNATNSIDLGGTSVDPAGLTGWNITGPAGQNVFWQGDVDNDWFNKDNWSTGCVPNAYDDVFFDPAQADPLGLGNTHVSIDNQQYAYCRSMIWQNWPGGVAPTVLDNFSTVPQFLFVYGHLIFQEPGTNSFDGYIEFRKDLTDPSDRPPVVNKNITSTGNHFFGQVYLAGHNDTYTLTDNSHFDYYLIHNNGFLVNPPGKTLTIEGGHFIGAVQGLDFHNSTIKSNAPGHELGFNYPIFNSAGSLVWMTQGGQVKGFGNTFHDVLFEENGFFRMLEPITRAL